MKLVARLLILPDYKYPGAKMKRLVQVLLVVIAAFITLASVSAERAAAAVYYMSPTGSDSNPGTSSFPWRTFRFAILKLQPGDTLLLKNGTYTASNSGLPTINCHSNATNGTASQPIIIKAENERQAHLSGDGSDETMIIRNCSHWTIEGLRISSADNPFQDSLGEPVAMYNSSNMVFRRNLFHNNNRYCNCHLMFMRDSHNNLIEENEFYHFHRHGFSAVYSNNNIVRRNYFHSRDPYRGSPFRAGHYDIPGGDEAFTFYPGNNNIAENNIMEHAQCTSTTAAPGAGPRNNRFLGNVCLNPVDGLSTYSYGDNEAGMSVGHIWENNVVIDSQLPYGAMSQSNARDWTFRNITVIGGAGKGAEFNLWPNSCCPPYSVHFENVLIIGANGGFFIDTANYSYTIKNSNVFNSGSSNVSGFKTINPSLGACRVFIPDGSPMKGAGVGGADIGANVLYRYENGVLTNQPLWDPITGAFPHGAIVPGVNDLPGSSAFDVHRRLNVNTNGCSLPSGYGGNRVASPPSPPRNLQIVR